MAAYDANGKIKLTASPGSGFVGMMAPDGSLYYTPSPGTGYVGSTAPDGSLYITDATGSTTYGVYAPDGSIRVTSGNEYNGAWRVSGISSLVASINFLSTTAIPSWMTFSRASNAMQFDSTGKLTYAPNNLLTYSNTFSNAAWTSSGVTLTSGQTDPLGGTNAWRLQGTTSTWLLYQSLSNINTNLVSYWVKSNTGSTQKVRLMLAGLPVGGDLNVTTSWTQISRTGVNNGSGSAGIIYDAAGDTVDILIYSAALSAVTYETTPRPGDQVITTASAYYGPRIDYTYNGSSWVPAGLLVEGAATNLYLNSSNLSAANTATDGVAKSTDGTLGPDNSSAMVKMTPSFGAGAHEFYQGIIVTGGVTYTASYFVKKGNHRYVWVAYETSSGLTGVLAVFDLDNPSAATQSFATGTSTLVTSGIINEGGGIYRIYVTGSSVAGGTGYLLGGFIGAATGNPTTTTEPNYSAAGTETMYAWGAQFEAGNLSSYTPTAAASITRTAETVQLTGTALSTLQGASGTVIAQIGPTVNSGISQTVVGAGVVNNTPILLSTNKAYTYSSAAVFFQVPGTLSLSSDRVGVAWSPSGRSAAANGGSIGTDANTISGLAAAYLGSVGSSYLLNGHIASVAFYNSRLPDATLQSKSVVGATY